MLAVSISVACAVAGLVVGTIGQTGIGLQFTESVVALSGGQLWLALFWWPLPLWCWDGTAGHRGLHCARGDDRSGTAGVGPRVDNCTHDYFLAGPKFNVTPPIALAAFAGAGVARGCPMAKRGGGGQTSQRPVHYSADDGLFAAASKR